MYVPLRIVFEKGEVPFHQGVEVQGRRADKNMEYKGVENRKEKTDENKKEERRGEKSTSGRID